MGVYLDENIEIVENYPSIYIKNLDLIVISDLQLGEELYLAEKRGIFIPQRQLEEMKNDVKGIYEKTKAKRLLINGDLKHEFGEASKQEWREVIDFVENARKYFKEIIVVRGNHDNYLLNIASKIGLEINFPYYKEKEFLFTHGHLKIKLKKDVKYLIIGHEQPAIVLREKYRKIKVPCLIFGKYKNIKLICLPAFSPLSSGTEINIVSKEELLSPILKDSDIDEFEVYGIDKEAGIIKFPALKFLRF